MNTNQIKSFDKNFHRHPVMTRSLPAVTAFLVGLIFLIPAPIPSFAQGDDLFADPAPAAKAPAANPAAKPAPAADPAPAAAADPAPAAASENDPASGVPAPAQNTSSENDGRGDNYLVWMIRSLGYFFTPVFICLSLAMVALVTMNIISIRRSVLVPEDLVKDFGRLLDEQKFQEAYVAAKEDESLLGKVLAAGLARMNTGYEKAEQAMQDVKEEESMRLQHRINYLALIGNLAPMVGLFGTVVGMIDSFQVIASGGAAPSPQKLAEGIATALFTTEIGLSIALPALAIYDIFRNKLDRFLLELSIISDNFMGRFSNPTQPK